MPARLKFRFRLVTALLALIVGVVVVAHSGAHLSRSADSRAEAACTYCQHSVTATVARLNITTAFAPVATVVVPVAPDFAAPLLRAHGSRGPPAV